MGRQNGTVVRKQNLLDEERSRTVFNGGGKKLLIIGDDADLRERLEAARAAGQIEGYRVVEQI